MPVEIQAELNETNLLECRNVADEIKSRVNAAGSIITGVNSAPSTFSECPLHKKVVDTNCRIVGRDPKSYLADGKRNDYALFSQRSLISHPVRAKITKH
jgi:hypothetical protein